MNINAIGGYLRDKLDGSFQYGNKEVAKCIAIVGVDKKKKNGDTWYTEEITVAIEFIGGSADEFHDKVDVGSYIIITYEVESREHNGKYFTSLRGKTFDAPGGCKSKSAEKEDEKEFENIDDDDLPF